MSNLDDFIRDHDELIEAFRTFVSTNKECQNNYMYEPTGSEDHVHLYRWSSREIKTINECLGRIMTLRTNLTDNLNDPGMNRPTHHAPTIIHGRQ